MSVYVQVKAGTPLMQLVAADWFKSNKREDHIAARDGCVIQKLFAKQVFISLPYLLLKAKTSRPKFAVFNIPPSCTSPWVDLLKLRIRSFAVWLLNSFTLFSFYIALRLLNVDSFIVPCLRVSACSYWLLGNWIRQESGQKEAESYFVVINLQVSYRCTCFWVKLWVFEILWILMASSLVSS